MGTHKSPIYSTNNIPFQANRGQCVEPISYHIEDKKVQQKGLLAVLATYGPPTAGKKNYPADTALLRSLAAAASLSQTERNGIYFQFPTSHSLQILEELAATDRLFFRGKRLVCDFFGKNLFLWQLSTTSSNMLQVQGIVKTRQGDLLVSECDALGGAESDALGAASWFIKGISLRLMNRTPSWCHIESLAEGPLAADDALLSHLIAIYSEQDSNSEEVLFLGHAYELATKRKEPLPFLRLCDRKGTFAVLWMDYGHGCHIAYHDPALYTPSGKEGARCCKRNLFLERSWEKDLLETDYVFKPVGTSQYYCPTDKVAKTLTFLLEVGWQLFDSQGRNIVRLANSACSWEEDSSHALVLQGSVRYGDHNVDIVNVVGAFNRRETFVSLAPASVGIVPENWNGTALEGAIDAVEVIAGELFLPRSHIVSLGSSQTFTTTAGSLRDLLAHCSGEKPCPEALPGKAFKGALRPYQQIGVNWLSFLHEQRFHGLLADDMGLGKTVQVLAFLSRLFEGQAVVDDTLQLIETLPETLNKAHNSPTLIVAPTSLIFNWHKEIERFLPSCSSVVLHRGPTRAKNIEELKHASLILTSFAILRLDLPLLSSLTYECLIIDEAQAIKNAHTETFRAATSIQARFRLSITGTPVENNLEELWSHFHFLIPGLLGKEKQFIADKNAGYADERHFQKIRRLIYPFLLRRKKSEVANDLPELIEQLVWVELGEKQRSLYECFLARARSKLITKVAADGIAKHRMEILETLLRLRQICCDPLLIASQLNEEPIPTSSKLELLLEDISTIVAEGGKALVYSQFTSMLQLIARALQERAIHFAYMDGSTVNRGLQVELFQTDPSIPLFLISLKAGGVGLNLTAADTVFLFDPWWNDAVEQQAIARAHRIGRKNRVVAKKLIAVETIEEKMVKLKGAKKQLAHDLLDETSAVASFSVEELDFLLS